jgi:hypothetical protein
MATTIDFVHIMSSIMIQAKTGGQSPMETDECSFKIVRTTAFGDEVAARSANLLVGRAAFETARRLYPRDRIEYRQGARVIERAGGEPAS